MQGVVAIFDSVWSGRTFGLQAAIAVDAGIAPKPKCYLNDFSECGCARVTCGPQTIMPDHVPGADATYRPSVQGRKLI